MVLSHQRAKARSQVIKKNSVSYHFHLAFTKDQYSGLAEISFDLISVPKQFTLDFSGKTIKKIIINSQLSQPKTDDSFIIVEVANLKQGNNVIIVHYETGYDNDGSGCCSFIDVDKKQYIYCLFEPYYANRVLPCFDQPDLKAKMQLNVVCPRQWTKVLSNQHALIQTELNKQLYLLNLPNTPNNSTAALREELQIYLQGKQGKMTLFPWTKPLPTYLFGCVAGQYLQVKHQSPYNGIPMSLFCIQSLYVSLRNLSDLIFQVTTQSMRFFESFFGYKFPFSKYDQIFVHEYAWGAMENAAIVTFNDKLIYTEKVSSEKYFHLANIVAHELSHHWFGNLVTMQWWDDLWLNQSFADFISHFCLDKISKTLKHVQLESPMASFLKRKGWGYQQDQKITTHPIRGPVLNTSVAESIFDGITYAKGAATMKQLLFLMGQENYSKALASYFHKYEWDNTTIDDFLGELQKQFKTQFTLQEWRQQWLQKESLNVLEAVWDSNSKGGLQSLTIRQTASASEHSTLRYHKIRLGLFTQDCQVNVIDVLIPPKGQFQVKMKQNCKYSAVLLNYDDYAFVKNKLDQVSLQFFLKNLARIDNVLNRSLIWKTCFDMVKDAQMKTDQFIEAILNNLSTQSSDGILQRQLDAAYESINTFTPQKARAKLNSAVFDFLYKFLPTIPLQQDNRIVIAKSKLVSFAKTDSQKRILINWSFGKDENLINFPITHGQKWSVVLNAFTMPDLSVQYREAMFRTQQQLDNSDFAKNYRLMCNALKSTSQEFQQIYLSFLDPKSSYSMTVKEYIASGWNHSIHSERLKNYRDRFFNDIQKAAAVLTADHFKIFYTYLRPGDDDLAYQIQRFEKVKLPPGMEKSSRNILKIVDDLKRRQKTYELYK